MTNPNANTIHFLNILNLDSNIIWPAYLGQAFSVVPFIGFENATTSFLSNETMNTLAAMSPYSRGTNLFKSPVNTSIVTETFSSFGDIVTLPITDIITSNTSCGTNQLCEQAKSIVVRIYREIMNQFFNGNGSGTNLNGLGIRADTTIDVGGGNLQLSHLEQLRYSVKPATTSGLGVGGNVWFSNEEGFREFITLLGRKSVKLKWQYVESLGVRLVEYLGALWCIDENVLTTDNLLTIYFVNLDYLRILYAKSKEYQTNEKGIMSIPVPMQASIAEIGLLMLAIVAFQNDPFAIARLSNIKKTVP